MKTIIRNFLSALRRFKMATMLNILGLSVAFAAFMVIMMQLNYDWNFARMHNHSDRIYRLEVLSDKGGQAVLSRPMAETFINSSPHILAGSICGFWGKNVFSIDANGGKNSFEEELIVARPEFTDVFEFNMLYGTGKALEDPEKVLISESISQKLFGVELAIGKTIYRDTAAFTVGGVYKDFPENTLLKNAIYKPIPMETDLNEWRNWGYQCFVRMDSPENSAFLIENYKKNFDSSLLEDGNKWVADIDYRLTALTDIHFTNDVTYDKNVPKSNRQTLLVLFAIALVIIIIAAINFTNFSTALAPVRLKSINTQKILGGDERSIRLSLVLEAISISFVSFLIALFLVFVIQYTPIRGLLNVDPSLLSHPAIVLGTLLLSLLTGCLAGIYPAYYITSFSPAIVLKGSYGLSPKGKQLRSALIGMQYLASFVLIIGALFMYLQNKYMKTSDLGYNKDRLIVTDINTTIEKNTKAFADQLKSFAEIEGVSFAHTLISSQDQYWGLTRPYLEDKISYECLVVDPLLTGLLDIHIVDGRDFREGDNLTRGGALIFNERARDQYQLKLGDKVSDSEIVGFMSDIKFASFRTEVVPMAFWVGGHREPEYAYIKVKKGADMQEAKNRVHEVLNSFDKGYPFHLQFFDNIFDDTYAGENKLGSLVLLFSLIAILISIVGVFGLVIFESEYRKKEIGIRKVLGSTVREIVILFNKSYIRILTICFILAVPLSYYAISKWLENFAYKTPMYWWVFIVAFIMVTIITSFTVTFQNWRAANANPVDSIKTE
ncbi:MAG: ABC transporter permease [Tannerella sp.]|jgi:putative ABC transport system permease protein|nr:ABC transporter permease [Tannerella sp.]